MPFVPSENTARVEIRQLLHLQQVSNIIYAQYEAAIDVAKLTELAEAIQTWWTAEIAPLVSSNLTLERVVTRDLTEAEAAGVDHAVSPSVSGGAGGGAMPGNVALAIKFVTGLTGRSRHGRVYQSGLVEAQCVQNSIDTAVRDSFVAAYDSLITAIASTDGALSVVSFYHGMDLDLAPRPDGTIRRTPHPRDVPLVTPVVSTAADLNLDSQRRRLNGRGI